MSRHVFGLRTLFAVGLSLVLVGCSDPEATKARHLEQGKAHMAAGRVADAIIDFRNALKVDAKYGEARFELAKAFEQSGNPQAAREYIRAADLLPGRADVQIKAATLLIAGQQFEQARKHADLAVKADPASVEAQVLRAHTLAGLKDVDGALAELQRATDSAPGDFRPLASIGAIEAATGKLAEAEAAFKKAVDADPKSPQARLALAYFYWSSNRTGEAEQMISSVLAANPDDVTGNRMIALLYMATGRVKEAEAPLRRLADKKDHRAALVLGDVYLTTGRDADARRTYEALRGEAAFREMAVIRLAGLDFRTGRRKEAHTLLDAELAQSAKSVRLLTLKTQMLSAEGRRDEALDAARKAVAADAQSADAQYVLGFAEAEKRNAEAATTAYKEALRLNPSMTAAQVELSRLLLFSGETDQALQLAQSAVKAAPQNAQARLTLARALLQKGDIRAAEADANMLVKVLPNAAAVHALLGRVLLARSDVNGAMRAFDRALELNPAEPEALTGRLSIDLSRKRPQDARGRVEKAMAAAPTSSEVLVTAARFERVDGNMSTAEKHLRRAIELEPSNLAAYNQLVSLYFSQNRLDEGKRELQEVVRLKPDSVPARTMIGIIEQVQGRTDEAVKVYDAILKDTSNAAVAANNLAYIYADRGQNLDLAVQLAQTAKSQLPEHPDVSDTLGWAYYKRGMPELAIKPLEFSVQKDPKNAMYLVHLGLAYAKAGRADKARPTLTQALALKADVEGAAEARAVLASLKN